MPSRKQTFDVVILGTGMAGLTLARHLLMETDKTVLLLDKRKDPAHDAPQKYGESLVQCGAYYLSKVLDLEEHLLTEHFLKYNLRFYWPTEGRENRGFEDYTQAYIRFVSNIATYQLDRNRFEEHLLKLNLQDSRCQFRGGVSNIEVDLSDNGGLHQVRYKGGAVSARWVVDATGRSQLMKRHMELSERNPVRHNATFFWVDGLMNIEKLTGRSHREIIGDPARRKTGHFPFVLATNHLCAEGQWFWIIPLHYKTSVGLVYDPNVVDSNEVSNPRKLIEYACRKWPMLAHDLPKRKILDEGRMLDFSYGSRQTISSQRWAMVGESGRFSDPLYSPGTDLIAIYNTLIVDAIQARGEKALREKCELAEQVQRCMYEAYLPSYCLTYNCLGDPEAFTLKYTWELAIYFGFYVFPMVANLYANAEFMRPFLRRFAIMGAINTNVQRWLSGFFQWKKKNPRAASGSAPQCIEFLELAPLRESEKLFYEVGVPPAQAVEIIDRHLDLLREFARYIMAHISASVIGDPAVLCDAAYISTLDLRRSEFDVKKIRAAYAARRAKTTAAAMYTWKCLDPKVLQRFIPAEMQRKSKKMSA